MTSEHDKAELLRKLKETSERMRDPASDEELKLRARKNIFDQMDSLRGVPPGTTAEENGIHLSSTETQHKPKPKRWWRKS